MKLFELLEENIVMRAIIGLFVIIVCLYMFISLIYQRKNRIKEIMTMTIISNSAANITRGALSFYRPESFLKMINSDENLNAEDTTFYFNDYCGGMQRMYYNRSNQE